MMHAQDLAKAMKIPADHFRWYAAFHNEGHHPHIHMMVWSDDPKEGFLTRDGIAAMRSKLTNTIFRDEMIQIYERKDVAYKELIEAAQDTMRELIQKMEHQLCDNPVIEEQMRQLVQALETTTGKKQYGYLKKPLKALVDTIVDELARQPEVAKCYENWNQIRDELNECYSSRIPREHLPLSQQKEFRRIKNDIIREAENIRLGLPTFEDEKMQDEPEPEAAHEEQRSNSVYEQARRYRVAKTVLQDVYALDEKHAEAVRALEQLWAEGYTVAAHQLGKFYRDDLSTMRDHEKAERWFRLSAEAGNDFSEYALGKLLLSQKRTGEAVRWLDKAAGHGNPFAQYLLGKLYLTGESVAKDAAKALEITGALYDQSKDMVRLCDELLEQLRNMMLLKSGAGQPELLTCLPDEQPRLEELTRQPSLDTILRQIALLHDCRERMQRNPGKRVELEMALLQLAVPHLAAPVQTAPVQAAAPSAPQVQPAVPETPAAQPAESESPAAESKPLKASDFKPVGNWADILAAYQAVNPAVSGSLAESSAFVAVNTMLIVAKNRFFLTLLKSKENAVSLRETVKQFLGVEYNIRAKCSEPEQQASKAQNLVQKAMANHLDTAVENE